MVTMTMVTTTVMTMVSSMVATMVNDDTHLLVEQENHSAVFIGAIDDRFPKQLPQPGKFAGFLAFFVRSIVVRQTQNEYATK
jgi:hypothetical protein